MRVFQVMFNDKVLEIEVKSGEVLDWLPAVG